MTIIGFPKDIMNILNKDVKNELKNIIDIFRLLTRKKQLQTK